MGQFHFYIKPFDDQGDYLADFIDVTDDVHDRSLSRLKQQLDNSQFDVGILRSSNMKLRLNNDDGAYSDVDRTESIFRFKRKDSQVKITWEPGTDPLVPGFFSPGMHSVVSEEVDLFFGLLNDDNSNEDIDSQDIEFQVLGMESVLNRMEVPFASISNGDLFSTAIETMLDQAPFNALVTVSGANISVGSDQTIDDKGTLENKTVLQGLKEVLLPANAVLYITGTTVYVSPRTAGATLVHTFCGQAATDCIEDILDIQKYSNGQNRMFNYWTWRDTTLLAQDSGSVTKFGLSKKEISTDLITDTTKRNNMLGDLRDEFGQPQTEFLLSTPLDTLTITFGLLDRVAVNYPSQVLQNENEALSYYGQAKYGESRYPATISNIEIPATDRFKILTRSINMKNETVEFLCRKI